MAELAPEYIFEQHTQPNFTEALEQPDRIAIDIRELPEFGFITRRARQMGEAIRDERMELLREGEFDAVPMPIDMTGTARKVVEAEHTYGAYSTEASHWRDALRGDAERQVAEATSKMTWGYFKPLVHTFDAEEGVFKAYNHSVRQIVENGISPMAEAEDTERSINDYRAELLDEAFIRSPYADEYVLFTISQCADWAIADYESDRAQGSATKAYGGYVPDIEKTMVRAVSFDSEKQERYVEQIALPGTVIDHDTWQDVVKVLGVVSPEQAISKTELHGMRIMVHKDVLSGALDLAKLADAIGEERTGQALFMGEPVDESSMDYADIPGEADRRNAAYKEVVTDLADKMLELERDGVDKWQTEIHVSNFLKNSLLEIVKQAPEQARVIFDDATADGLLLAQQYRQTGRYDEAIRLEAHIEATAPAPSSCGAGSCGLAGVDSASKEAYIKKHGGEKGDSVLKDEVRRCKCGSKSIVYIFNSKKVIKYCESCDAEERSEKAA